MPPQEITSTLYYYHYIYWYNVFTLFSFYCHSRLLYYGYYYFRVNRFSITSTWHFFVFIIPPPVINYVSKPNKRRFNFGRKYIFYNTNVFSCKQLPSSKSPNVSYNSRNEWYLSITPSLFLSVSISVSLSFSLSISFA